MENIASKTIIEWFFAAKVVDFPEHAGACVKYKDQQIAVFNFGYEGEWYATQNKCPHKHEMALSRGLTGDSNGEPKVACPFHKKTFSLKTGDCLTDTGYAIETYPVKVSDGKVYIGIHE